MEKIPKIDENQEAAMIKTCLLFDEKENQKREHFFQKRLLFGLFCGFYASVEQIKDYLGNMMPSYATDNERVTTALHSLEKDGFVVLSEDGTVVLTEKANKEGGDSAERQRVRYVQLIDDIMRNIEANVPQISNRSQVRQNVKDCLEYYMQTSCYKYLALDDGILTNDKASLSEKASNYLPKDDRLVSQMLLSIGSVIDKPSDIQRKTLETMAQAQITMRLMGMDLMLQNFKRTMIANKVFVLDTDVLLYLVTDYGERSRQYKALLQQLLGCGCNIYVPNEVLGEIYDHAEAAKKRYYFVSPILNGDVGRWAEYGINNVFLESYYSQKEDCKINVSWDTYIGNYFNSKYGASYTKDAVTNAVGTHRNMHYGVFPDEYDIYLSNKEDDKQLRDSLYGKTLQATLNTEKAETRDRDKNERIAQTDTRLFLNIKKLNELEEMRSGGNVTRSDYLCQRYYVVTNTFRIYSCTKELGMADRILCSPSALMAFMVEAGIMNRTDMDVLSLFDNPFLAYVAEQSLDDVRKMVQTGIDFKGKSIVRLRYDLQNQIECLLTAQPGTEAYNNAVDEVKQQGYDFKPQIERVRELEKQNADKDKQIEEMQRQLEKLKAMKKGNLYEVRIERQRKNGKR